MSLLNGKKSKNPLKAKQTVIKITKSVNRTKLIAEDNARNQKIAKTRNQLKLRWKLERLTNKIALKSVLIILSPS